MLLLSFAPLPLPPPPLLLCPLLLLMLALLLCAEAVANRPRGTVIPAEARAATPCLKICVFDVG